MEHQIKLWRYDHKLAGRAVTKLHADSFSLEFEKEKFIGNMCNFIDNLNFETIQIMGRPKADFRDIVKSLLVMSYHGFSYRRTLTDLRKMHEDNLLSFIPSRSVLNLYANDKNTPKLLEKLIQSSALFFTDNENTLIIDSTWLALKMYLGGYKKVHDKKNCSFDSTRKLHIGCLKNSKIVAYAKATPGTTGDNLFFQEIVKKVTDNGFNIENILADAAYTSKDNFAFCKEMGIIGVYIDFRSNASEKRGKSDIWKEKLKMFKEQKAAWKEAYRHRALVEGVFSAIKRKHLNYLRSRNETAQDVELLLKVLVYNLTVIGRFI